MKINDGIKRVLLIFLILLTVLVMVFSFGGRDKVTFLEDMIYSVVSPLQKVFSGIGYFLEEKTEPFFNVLNYKTVNENLSKENSELKEQVVELTMTKKELLELRELKLALRFVEEKHAQTYVSADVIAKDVGNWFSFFTINAGSKQGIVKNSTVIDSKGLVGQVYEVGSNYSKVISIIDKRSSVSFEMLRKSMDYDGILSGTKDYELIGEFYDPKAKIAVGEYIVTSGLGIYPKGILIGKIYEVIEDKDNILRKVKIEPVVNFRKINKVLVLPYRDPEREDLSDASSSCVPQFLRS